jgi:cell division protein ZapA (FtsZ GTPase activity inhibitor)
MKVSRVIEAKSVTSAYIGWRNTLQLTVDGGELNITLDESSIRSIANVLNNKIAELEEEKAEAAAEATAEKENDE